MHNLGILADRDCRAIALDIVYSRSSLGLFLYKNVSLAISVYLNLHVSRVVGNVHNCRITIY